MNKFLTLLLCVLLTLPGVHARGEGPGLPPYVLEYEAPENDSAPTRTADIKLYLPNEDSSALVAVDTVVVLRPFKWYVEPVLEALFSWRPISGQPTKARSLQGDPQFRLKLLKFGLSRGYEYEAVEEALNNLPH